MHGISAHSCRTAPVAGAAGMRPSLAARVATHWWWPHPTRCSRWQERTEQGDSSADATARHVCAGRLAARWTGCMQLQHRLLSQRCGTDSSTARLLEIGAAVHGCSCAWRHSLQAWCWCAAVRIQGGSAQDARAVGVFAVLRMHIGCMAQAGTPTDIHARSMQLRQSHLGGFLLP